ncbi:unnamed protein product [Cladocopium goreaui]|uniref:Uncharacterized protein n=1 Tax=Cladocopium goreaui TaxID=2562237 RepID=A0A9P1D5E0_9DINO|nr:unnamed protein product [Cladocopium goreaui]
MRFSRLSADKQRNFTRSGNPGCPSVTKIWCTPKGGKHSTAPWWSQKAFPAVAEDITVDPVEVAAPAEAAAEAAPLLAEDITLDDRSAELTAPAEVPERTTEDDVAEEPVKSPKAVPAVAEDITVDDPVEVAAPAEGERECRDVLYAMQSLGKDQNDSDAESTVASQGPTEVEDWFGEFAAFHREDYW